MQDGRPVSVVRVTTRTPRAAPAVDFAALADAGWPALERVDVDGWVARFAQASRAGRSPGVTQRANSVYPPRGRTGTPSAIAEVERLYRERGLPPLFQLADVDEELFATLVARGYEPRNETLVLAAPLAVVARALDAAARRSSADLDASTSVTAAPDDEWLDLWWSVDGRGGDAEREVARGILTGGDALYATVPDECGAASVGRLALVSAGATGEADTPCADTPCADTPCADTPCADTPCANTLWGGLYALATREDARGRGHARTVIRSLVRAGAAHDGSGPGVAALWLQVLASNSTARRLYDGLGFEQVATYRYLLAPDR